MPLWRDRRKSTCSCPIHKGDVRYGVHELVRVRNHPAAHGVGPKIFGLLELIKNLDRLGHINLAI